LNKKIGIAGILIVLVGTVPSLLWAAPPNVVLSRALHFSSSEGTPVTLDPGKYFVEQAGPSALRLTPEGSKPSVIIQAEPLTHEQYELFSPMALTRPQKDETYLIELLLPGGVRLEAKGSTKPPVEPPTTANASIAAPQHPLIQEPQIDKSLPSPVPIPSHPAQGENSVGSSSSANSQSRDATLAYQAPALPSLSSQDRRVIADARDSGQDPNYLAVLSPNHTGLTIFEQPALFWYIAQPASHPVDIRITDEGNDQVLLDVRMLPPIMPGIHKIDLKDYGIRLHLNTTYQWTVTLSGNNPEENSTTHGWIMRIAPPPNLTGLIHLPSIVSISPRSLIEAGLWYDGIWVLSERIQAQPADTTSLEQRANLFEQVGLIPPAQHDRSHLPLP
jgi:hypothetical protein